MDYFIIILFGILIIILLISYYNRFILNKHYLKENFQDIYSDRPYYIDNEDNEDNLDSEYNLDNIDSENIINNENNSQNTSNNLNNASNYESNNTNPYTINNNYLYPVQGLSGQCEKIGLKPAFMPQICSINGVVNSYANCMCQDKEGNCQKCYPELEKYNKASHVIYNDNVSMEYTPYNIKSINPDSLVDKNNEFDIHGIGSNNNYEELPQPGIINNEKCKKYYDDLQKCNNELSS